jgi:UPF0755 protein
MDKEEENKIEVYNQEENVEVLGFKKVFLDFLKAHYIKILKFIVIPIFLLLTLNFVFIASPSDFPENSIKTILKGSDLKSISKDLKESDYIKSATLFQSLSILFGGEKRVIAGDYLFTKKENVFKVVMRIINGDFGMEEVKVTIPEGLSNTEVADILSNKIINFDKTSFLYSVKNIEGYLFPDTYFFPPTAKNEDITLRMENNFKSKLKQFENDIEKSGKSTKDIITMASILEGEAKDKESRQIVSGILWQRIKKNIPLQVDATFKYINGKGTKDLTLDDLKIKSPYNTYVNLGLPPGPINNPGEEAIFASLNPIKTDYLYFLTGKDGKMYYAKTFDEHKKNKEKYLK